MIHDAIMKLTIREGERFLQILFYNSFSEVTQLENLKKIIMLPLYDIIGGHC